MMRLILGSMLAAFVAQTAQQKPPPDPASFVDAYAPIVQFNAAVVRVLPQTFWGEPAGGLCTYVNIRPLADGLLYQYWLYYPKDIRVSPEYDKALKAALEVPDNKGWMDLVNKLFHEHDWELVEVHVPAPGEPPDVIGYGFHTRVMHLPTRAPIGAAPMQGTHPVVKVVSDMHGCYPSGGWGPADAMLNPPGSGTSLAFAERNVGVTTEFALAYRQELIAGHGVPGTAPYNQVAFAGHCSPFTESMKRTHKLDGYPYRMPWDKGWDYEAP